MSSSVADVSVRPRAPAPRRVESRGYLAATWLRLSRDRISMVSLVGLTAITLLSVLAPVIATSLLSVDPFRQDLFNQYAPPSPRHWLGTDDLGRDALARVLIAGQASISVGFAVAIVSLLVGVPIGLASGYFGGRFDDVSNGVIQILQNIPTLFLFILLSVTLRPALLTLAVLIGVLSWTGTARQVRALALAKREQDYVLAARVMGATDGRIMAQHVFPNLFSVVTVIAGFDMAGGILVEAGLSYLGLGVQPPTPSWGNMLTNSLENVTRAPWLVIGPGVAIFLTMLSILLLADGLRDAMDPRLR